MTRPNNGFIMSLKLCLLQIQTPFTLSPTLNSSSFLHVHVHCTYIHIVYATRHIHNSHPYVHVHSENSNILSFYILFHVLDFAFMNCRSMNVCGFGKFIGEFECVALRCMWKFRNVLRYMKLKRDMDIISSLLPFPSHK